MRKQKFGLGKDALAGVLQAHAKRLRPNHTSNDPGYKPGT